MNITLPKISKGVWTDNAGTVWMADAGRCAVFSTIAGDYHDRISIANAKACSAVPELLEALKLAAVRLEELDYLTGGEYPSTATRDVITEALTKAGCTIS